MAHQTSASFGPRRDDDRPRGSQSHLALRDELVGLVRWTVSWMPHLETQERLENNYHQMKGIPRICFFKRYSLNLITFRGGGGSYPGIPVHVK